MRSAVRFAAQNNVVFVASKGNVVTGNRNYPSDYDEKFIFQNCENAFGTNQNYYAYSEKERELFEKRIEHLEGKMIFLRNQLESK